MAPDARTALLRARAAGVARLDALVLLEHHTGHGRTWLLAHDDQALPAASIDAFEADLARRADGVPLAYLIGERDFHGLALQVTPAVLDPRPDTETLVEWALALLQGEGAPLAAVATPDVIDLGTGSGAIALALAHACPRARVRAVDLSESALAVARANGQRLQLPVAFSTSDWWSQVGAPRLHLAVSNPPYIAAHDPHLAALRHEPALALTPGGDGLGALETLIAGAPAHLLRDGWLLLEHGHDQADAVTERLHRAGFVAIESRHDLAGHRRCTGGRWPH